MFLQEIPFSQNIHRVYLCKEMHKTAEKMEETDCVLLVEVIDLCSFSPKQVARQEIQIREDVYIPETVSVHWGSLGTND